MTQAPVISADDAPLEGPPGAPDTPFRPFDEEPPAAPVDAPHSHDEGRGDRRAAPRPRSPITPTLVRFAEPLDEDEEEDEDELEVTTLDGGAEERAPRARRSQRRGRRRGDRAGRRRCDGGDAAPRAAPAPPVQDPGSHQAPPGSARAGGQGGARQQGRGLDDLSVAGRPLFRPDAEHRARRRHFAQDHQHARSQPPQVDRPGSRSSRGHGRDPAHRGRLAHQGGGEARFRISAAHVGDRSRTDAVLERADARLRGGLADQAGDPRPLRQGCRGGGRRRRGGLSRSQGIHAPADAEPRQERAALSRRAAGFRARRRRSAARRDVLEPGHAEVGRLYRHQSDRSPRGDRREFRPFDARAQYRGHRASHQSRGGRRNRPAVAPARSGRPDRPRSDRHGGMRATIARSSGASRMR